MTPGAEAALRRAFRQGYGLGCGLCLAWPLLALGGLHLAPRLPEDGSGELGPALSGLALLIALAAHLRLRALRSAFPGLPEARRAPRLRRELALAALLFGLLPLLGLVHRASRAPGAARHAVGFVLMAPLAFLALVPRFRAWRRAAQAGPLEDPALS